MDKNHQIGEWVKKQRLKKHWTVDAVAKCLNDETPENLVQYEEGKRPLKCFTFYELIHLYQIDSDELFAFMQEIGVWCHR